MRLFRAVLCLALALFVCTILNAQIAPVCDSGGVCGPSTTDPSYSGAGGIIAARPQVQNARGTSSSVIAAWGGPLIVRRPIGSQSYNKAIPILSLPGRGLDLNLTLYYNSRVWTLDPAANSIAFNADRDFPSYGFRLDFGYVEYDSADAQMILTESDGTKHAMPLHMNITGGALYDSNDGTFIEYNSATNVLSYKNGTMVTYQQFPSTNTLFRPIQIMDTNRNFITIAYVTTTGNDQHIDTITDTLGRVIHFNYTQNQLTSITQAVSTSTDPTGIHTWATFKWLSTTLSYNFASTLSVVGSPGKGSAINVLAGCTYPNGTGYQFSYGAWGIVNRIDLLSAQDPNDSNMQHIRSYETYNFPDASVALNDAPAYTQQTVSPDGSSTSVWNFSISETGPGQITGETITDQLGTVTTLALNSDGTLNSTKITDNSGRFFRQQNYTWKAVGTSTMIASVATTDNGGNVATTSYTYDANGNVADLKELDFNNSVLRETVTTYEGSPFTTQHILNLPQTIQVKDGSGAIKARTDFAYDSVAPVTNGITTPVTQNDGNSTAARGNLTSITRYFDPVTPGGDVIRNYTYDILGNLINAQLDCCNQQVFNFDPATKYAYVQSVVRGPGTGPQFTTNFTFNPDNGLVLRSTDENGQPTTSRYDDMYRLANVTNPLSVTQTISYDDTDAAPAVTTTTNANSTKVVQKFDGLAHVTEQDTIDSSASKTVSTTQYQYDAIWREIKKSNPYALPEPLVWTTTGYDALDRVTSITPPSGGGTTFSFSGNTILIKDPASKQRLEYFDPLGRLIRVDEPGWGDAFAAVDSASITSTAKDRSKTTTTKTCVQWSLKGTCILYEFDTNTFFDTGNVTITVNGKGYVYTYGQNDTSCTSVASGLAGQINADPSRVVNASASSCTVNLSAVTAGAAGNSITVSSSSLTTDPTDFGAGTTSFPISTATPTLTGGQDAVSEQSPVITATRHLTTTYGYDVFDNVVSVSAGAMGPVNGQQLAGQQRSYSYDPLDRLNTVTTPESGTVTNYYTKSDGTACAGDPSLVCGVLDARGVTKNFSYDGINRVSGITYTNDPAGTPAVSYHYDAGAYALDRLTSVSDGANSETITYDQLGRIGSATYSIDGTNYPVQYHYNTASEMSSLTYPSGRVVTPDYDTVGRLKDIKDITAGNTYLSINNTDYNGAGELTKMTYGNGVIGQFGYNDHLQLSSLRYYNPSAPAGTADVLNLSYDYTSAAQTGNNGQIQAIHYFTTPGVENQAKSESFAYDGWLRLSSAQTLNLSSSGTWQLLWNYDRLGNRSGQSLTAGTAPPPVGQPQFLIDSNTNRIASSGFQYDGAGNMMHDAAAAYTYDGANRMTSVNNGNAVATYTYFGPFRIKKIAGGATTLYVYSGSEPIAEYVNGQLSSEYIYSGSQLLATVSGTTITYHHPDHLSNRAETDTSGSVTRTFGHLPYGETWYESGTPDKWKFTAYERDSASGETSLDYAVFRYYASGEGRFRAADMLDGTALVPQSWNRYAYALNDPVNQDDPLGLECVTFDDGTVGDDGLGQMCDSMTQGDGSPDAEVWGDGPEVPTIEAPTPSLPPIDVTGIPPLPAPPPKPDQPPCGPDGFRDATPEERQKILDEAKKFQGTKYKYGGDSQSGIDCSHLVCRAIQNAGISFSYSTTRGMGSNPALRSIDPSQMTAGDILLFSGHVGFYDPNSSQPGMTLYSARGGPGKSTPGVTAGNPNWYGPSQSLRVRVKCR